MLNDDITALIDSISIPVITGALRCADEFFPHGSGPAHRNHVGDKVCFAKNIPFSMEEVLFDPQTSGGTAVCSKSLLRQMHFCMSLKPQGFRLQRWDDLLSGEMCRYM